jgi:hypothetical protein
MSPFNTGGCSIEVTAWTGLTVDIARILSQEKYFIAQARSCKKIIFCNRPHSEKFVQ